MTIEVTEDDIINGEPTEPCKCPVALALERATGKQWIVSCNDAGTSEEEGYALTMLPPDVRDFIKTYDNRGTVSPFTFYMDIKDEKI